MHCVASSKTIKNRVEELGRQITVDYHDNPPTVLWIANGSLYFTADLTREIKFDLPFVECIKARSYHGTLTGPIKVNIEAIDDEAIVDKDVLLIDDILDTGQTLHEVSRQVLQRGARSVAICVLLVKEVEGKRKYPVVPTYGGFEIDDHWVVGYGLDWDNASRNQPYIGVPREKIKRGVIPRLARVWHPKVLVEA